MIAQLPAERLRELVKPLIERAGGIAELAQRSRVPERTIYALLSGERRFVHFRTADAILAGVDAVELWHVPPPEGLADLYAESRDARRVAPRLYDERNPRRPHRHGSGPRIPPNGGRDGRTC